MRIDAAQDMMIAGFDALATMQAGGWKSTSVVLRYGENAATCELHERRWAFAKTSDLSLGCLSLLARPWALTFG